LAKRIPKGNAVTGDARAAPISKRGEKIWVIRVCKGKEKRSALAENVVAGARRGKGKQNGEKRVRKTTNSAVFRKALKGEGGKNSGYWHFAPSR